MCRFGFRWRRSPSRSTGPGPTVSARSRPTRHHGGRGHVHPGRRRAGRQHAARGCSGLPNQPDTHYDKIHLYDAFGFTESRTVAPGREPVVITVDGVGVGLSTCYDIRFPELFTTLARRGAQLIVVSASWASGPGKLEQWTLLARARALDSTSYIVAAGQADPGEPLASSAPTGVGGSLVVSPFGEVVASAGADPKLLVADLALEQVAKARETIAVLRNHSARANADKAESPG